jgi:aminodeoxychorismate lyase
MNVFLNGRIVPEEQAVISVFDRGFCFGDGLFETIRVFNGRPFRWAQHLDRLNRGAGFLKIPMPFTPQELRKHADELLKSNEAKDCLIKVNLSRGPGPRGYSPVGAETPNLVMSTHPAPEWNTENPPQFRVIFSEQRMVAHSAVTAFKTTDRLLNVLAAAEAEAAGADDAILMNTNGEVVCTTSGNLFWVHKDTVYTTPSGHSSLPGITRAVVLEICQALALPTGKRVIKPDHLLRSEGLFITNSARGIIPIGFVGDEPVRESGLLEPIMKALSDVVAKA